MARTVLPDALTRREWVEQPSKGDRDARVAEAYLADGRRAESLVFLARSGGRELLRELAGQAVQEGDAFLLREACRALGEEPSREQWTLLAEAAVREGKESYAVEARRQALRREE
ncbi:MAG: hypothetical protein ABFS46_13230 [Myxococcota bacterium]